MSTKDITELRLRWPEIVVWNDTHADTRVVTAEEAAEIGPVVTITIGWVISSNKEGVVLAADLYPTVPDEAYGPMFIPHGCIVSRTRLDPRWSVVLREGE